VLIGSSFLWRAFYLAHVPEVNAGAGVTGSTLDPATGYCGPATDATAVADGDVPEDDGLPVGCQMLVGFRDDAEAAQLEDPAVTWLTGMPR
jgi:hypothetical protein